ncbi:MAG: FecR domain-containing protein [Kofleriaceae bacterium]
MICPPVERLAAAVSGEDDDVLVHIEDCAACQQILEEQNAMRVLVAQTPAPRLLVAHREELAAEVLARADWMPVQRRRMVPLVGASLAVAAAIAIAFGLGAFDRTGDEPIEVATIHEPDPPIAPPAPIVTPIVTPPAPTRTDDVVVAQRPARVDRSAKLEGTADFTRKLTANHEIVKLASGELTVDTDHGATRPVQVVTGDGTLAFKRARVKVVATKGAIAQVSVFSGTAEITVNGTKTIIEAGMVWERPATPADSSSVFQEGWAALREGRNADAIAAFDLAVDPMVAEDALYWGAIASERNNDPAGARQRYELLVEKFPKSPRAKKAKKALARLAPPTDE